jgi:hypothetical protein
MEVVIREKNLLLSELFNAAFGIKTIWLRVKNLCGHKSV